MLVRVAELVRLLPCVFVGYCCTPPPVTMYCEQEFYEVPMDSQVLIDKTVIGKRLGLSSLPGYLCRLSLDLRLQCASVRRVLALMKVCVCGCRS